MRRILLALSTVIGVVIFASSAVSASEEKVTLCHAAGLDGTTQYVTITVGYPAAYGEAGHFYENGTPRAGHEDDYLGECDEDDTTTTTSSTTTSSTTTTTEPKQTTTTTAYHPPCIDCFATTTVAETTTTVAETSTTSTEPPVVTTTTPPPPPTTQPPTTPQLPDTGSTSGLLAAIASLLTFAGGAALWARRA